MSPEKAQEVIIESEINRSEAEELLVEIETAVEMKNEVGD